MITLQQLLEVIDNANIAQGAADLTGDQPLEAQGFDSFDRMTLLVEVEQAFEVEIPNDVSNQLQTLDDIVNYVNQQNAQSGD